MFNPSTKKGGTLRMANSGDWDSLDRADTYYGYAWDFAAALRPFADHVRAEARRRRQRLVPDLATSLGEPSADAKTWTYNLRRG